MESWRGKTFLVSGAGSGLGRVVAQHLHAKGARLVLLGRRLAPLQATCPEAMHASVDHADERAVAAFACTCPSLDGMCLAAGALVTGSVESTPIQDFDSMIHANLRGPWLLCHHLGKHLVSQASVVLVGSNIGIRPIPDSAAYCVAKAGLHMLAQVLALEWASRGIRCNAIAPGPVHTAMVEQRLQASEDPMKSLQALQGVNPMRRLGTEADITHWVLHLLSNASAWTTGTVIPIDGGATAVM